MKINSSFPSEVVAISQIYQSSFSYFINLSLEALTYCSSTMTWFEGNTELDEPLYGYYDCRYKDVKLTVKQDPNDIEKIILALEAICLGKKK